MRLLSPILQRVVYPTLGKAGYFRSKSAAAVVTYHGVLPEGYRSEDLFLDNTLVSVEVFQTQLKLFKKCYNVISPEFFLQWLRGVEELPERAVLLTCDDGLLNNLTVMLPLLQEQGLRCLFFVTGKSTEPTAGMLWYIELYLLLQQAKAGSRSFECCGVRVPEIPASPTLRRAVWGRVLRDVSVLDEESRIQFVRGASESWEIGITWKDSLAQDARLRARYHLLGPSELKLLAESGMTLGAHTMSHPILSVQPEALVQREITACKRRLTDCIESQIWALAYPFGDPASVGARERRIAQDAGYDCAFMNISGALNRECRFSLPRVHVTSDMSWHVLEAHLSGFHSWVQRAGRSF